MSCHSHVCAGCNRVFECAGDDCEAFHFSICRECSRPAVEHDAPPAGDDLITLETEQ